LETVVESKTKTVLIGPNRPFTIIGERINPTGRKKLAAEIAAGNFDRVVADAVAQVEAGAQMLDVNVGIPLTDEPALLEEAIRLVQSVTEVPLSIDSSIVAALKSGLEAYQGKALVNSVTGEEERLESILPLIKKHSAAVIGISNDESGISEDPDVRFEVAKRIVERAMDHGIPKEDVIIDPLVMPIGAMPNAGQQVFHIVRRVREELGCNTVCGASNISFGLPNRPILNATFLPMAIAAGMTSAITNPLEKEIIQAILAADVLMGNDENCMEWIQINSDPGSGNGGRREGRRRSRRRRRERER
jgi:5-methyltetrahydrofolate--homocysteine methyltransferase